MNDKPSSNIVTKGYSALRRTVPLVVALVVASAWQTSVLADDGGRGNNDGDHNGHGRNDNARKGYQQNNLVADLPDVAILQDTNLVNAWGISFGPSNPFWVSANGTGLALLYSVTNDSQGMSQVSKLGLEVTIPGEGNPTGQLFNNTTGFHTNLFIFASEDGTISGWRPALGTAAEVLASDPNAVFKGITLASTADGPMLLLANFSHASVDVYDGDLNLVGQFSDPNAPDGYAPFNVQSLGGMVFVTFAKQDADKLDDVPGSGHGLIDIFNPATGVFHRFSTGTDAGGRNAALNSPWGLAISPEHFGEHSDELLVGNFGDGTIMAFSDRGRLRGLLEDTQHRPIVIDGLWALTFGNGTRAGVPGTLYFSAGPDGESHGLFGSLEPAQKAKRGRGHHGHD
jgi:uncharacterized protein (TIGR03118 family)